MLEKLIFALTALLGFITLLIIGSRYKTNRHINFYLILFFFLGNIHFLIHSLSDVFPMLYIQKLVDLLLYINIWPLFYLYFSNLVNDHKALKIKELIHIIVPTLIFLFFFSLKEHFSNHNYLVEKIVFLTAIVWNLIYALASYRLLQHKVWKRNSDILIINQQNKIIKQWTQLLFSLFALMFIRFLISILFIKGKQWYTMQNDFLWIGGVVWIFLYCKILYSPNFLYGYKEFQNKINEYKKHSIIFNNIWIMDNSKPVTNIQDTILKEKINSQIENYIIGIEYKAVNTNLFFSKNLQIEDVAHKLNIPKSHLLYIFKYHASISFADFKRIIRVQKIILLLEEDYLKFNTMEALANETGFSSYSTFFTSFKSITGVSPQEYCKNR